MNLSNLLNCGMPSSMKNHLIANILTLLLLSVPCVCFGAETPSFTLGPGDIIEISVWKDQDLTRQVIVQPDGYVNFPLIGQIKAAGRTIPEVRKEVEKGLSDYMSMPNVTVTPVKIESYKIYVIGKVNKPGMFVVLPRVTVLQALSMAGGTNPFADLGDIVIIRHSPNGETKIDFDYDDIAAGKNLEQNIELQSGDVVLVP